MAMRVGALDVGHGCIKGIVQVGDEVLRQFVYASFVVRLREAQTYNKSLRVVPIKARGDIFLVGPDAWRIGDHRYDTRLRSREYPSSTGYQAHCEGGIAFMEQAELDVLAVALPLSTIDDEADNLERLLRGTHYVPNPATGGRELMRVIVHNVIVISQPVAALLGAVGSHPELAEGWVLAVDPGFHTIDYLLAHNLEPNHAHSGVIEAGACEFLDRLSLHVEDQFAKAYPSVRGGLGLPRHRFEQALASGATILKTPQGDLDLSSALVSADQLLDDYWTTIISDQASLQDIQHVVIAGGLADRFARVFHKRHPTHTMPLIAAAPEPQFAVARGLLAVAIDYYNEQHEGR
jgi:PRTRC genetic system protein D